MNMTRRFGGLRMHRVVVPPAEQARVQHRAKTMETTTETGARERNDKRAA